METKILKINRDNIKAEDFEEAAKLLKEGKLVAFPTETVYGLGGNAFDPTASARIYAAKGRPSDNPLIVHIAAIEALTELATDIPDEAYRLADSFWPGPLTIILKKSDAVPKETTGGLDTVAVRMPSDEIARQLIAVSGVYVAAPSANLSGRPSTTKAEHVIEDLSGRIDMIIDGGSSDIGLESTIVDLTGKTPLILRPGFVTIEQLSEILPNITYDKAVLKKSASENIVAKAPGMKYRHYAPKGELTIYEGTSKAVISAINKAAEQKSAEGFVTGVIATDETYQEYKCDFVKTIGSRSDENAIASRLFDLLREFDKENVAYIFTESFNDNSLGQAIMNRLLKAAGYKIIDAETKG